MSLFAHYLSLPYLLEGIWFTVVVTALGLAGGLILGLVLAAMQLSRFSILAGRGLGMAPALLMRRIIAPQAIRTMIPAFGNETVSALKNSSLASVISVQELTLRSTQLASSTFDFFSIFFASGLIYLVLTTGVSVMQLFVKRALDLDRTTKPGRLAIFLPWRRVDLSTKLTPAEQATASAVPVQSP